METTRRAIARRTISLTRVRGRRNGGGSCIAFLSANRSVPCQRSGLFYPLPWSSRRCFANGVDNQSKPSRKWGGYNQPKRRPIDWRGFRAARKRALDLPTGSHIRKVRRAFVNKFLQISRVSVFGAPCVCNLEVRKYENQRSKNGQRTADQTSNGAREIYVRNQERLRRQRSSRDFTAEEQRRSVTGCHGWLVFNQP